MSKKLSLHFSLINIQKIVTPIEDKKKTMKFSGLVIL